MPQLQGYEEQNFDAVSIPNGVYQLTIDKVRDNTKDEGLDWCDLSLRLTFAKNKDVPFPIERSWAITYPKGDKKGTAFILSQLLSAAGVQVQANGSFKEQDLIGKTISVYLFMGESGYMDCWKKVWPASLTDAMKTRMIAQFNKDVKGGYVKLFDPNETGPSSGKTERPGAKANSMLDDAPASKPVIDEEDLPF